MDRSTCLTCIHHTRLICTTLKPEHHPPSMNPPSIPQVKKNPSLSFKYTHYAGSRLPCLFSFNSKSLPPPPCPPTLPPPPRSTSGSGHATLPRLLVFQLLHLRTPVFQLVFPLRVPYPPRRTAAPRVPQPRPPSSVPSARRVRPEESGAHGRPTPTVPKRCHFVPSRIGSGEIRLRKLQPLEELSQGENTNSLYKLSLYKLSLVVICENLSLECLHSSTTLARLPTPPQTGDHGSAGAEAKSHLPDTVRLHALVRPQLSSGHEGAKSRKDIGKEYFNDKTST